ncbi:MAG: sugar kinase [Oscillospiraceae bacterium]|jgi:sugar/nucleoside kinase (ribokinase family)|nr:sugar kinase [Oscillospiraceae bacterium]
MPETRFDRVIVIGDACVDVTVSLQSVMSSGDDEYGSERLKPILTGGGTSANTAVALSKLGVPTAFMGTVGDDYGGRFMMKEFAQNGINTDFTIMDKSNTIFVFAFIDPTGERTLWGFPREDCSYARLDLEEIDLEKVRTASWVHSSGMAYMTEGSIRQNLPLIFKAAYEAGVPTSFDLNTRVGDPDKLEPEIRRAVEETLPYVKYLLGSAKDEFYSFCPKEDWRDSVRHFATEGRSVVSRMGGDGAFLVSDSGEELQKPYQVTVKNTTGAGDAFNAGFIAGMLQGLSLSEAVLQGSAVAGFKVAGNSSRHTPTPEQLKEFMAKTPRKQ